MMQNETFHQARCQIELVRAAGGAAQALDHPCLLHLKHFMTSFNSLAILSGQQNLGGKKRRLNRCIWYLAVQVGHQGSEM
jgi:hypothetical protein